MSLPRLFFLVSFLLFSVIGALTLMKRNGVDTPKQSLSETPVVKISPESLHETVDLTLLNAEQKKQQVPSARLIGNKELVAIAEPTQEGPLSSSSLVVIDHEDEQEAIQQLFVKGSACPIVETVRYSSRVSWKPKKQAWLVDYASYYKTPVDFIIHSITGAVGKNAPAIQEGQQFNVFKRDAAFYFHMVISFSSKKMRLYYVLPKENRVVFLKSYPICLGRKDSSKVSGSLTPFGVFQLGSRVACFHPKMMGNHKGARVELIQVFGTRWIPFETEIDCCTEPAKGLGIHGAPLVYNATTGQLEENNSGIGDFVSDGCIRLKRNDVEELFSVISTRPSYVEIVSEFRNSQLLQGRLYTQSP
jgi:hypothetical protein